MLRKQIKKTEIDFSDRLLRPAQAVGSGALAVKLFLIFFGKVFRPKRYGNIVISLTPMPNRVIWRTARAAWFSALARVPYYIRQPVLGLLYTLQPKHLPGLAPTLYVVARDISKISRPHVPQTSQALRTPDGLCGLAGHLDVVGLIEGYRRGMYVYSQIGFTKWWSTSQRMVLFLDEARVEKGVQRLLRSGRFEITFDRAFDEVIFACAQPRSGKVPVTWITPKIRKLFLRAYEVGYAHSVEVWNEGKLVGGVYGLAIGRVFFTESQFHTIRDGSKLAFAVLNKHLQKWEFSINDGKSPTQYLANAGMRPILRSEFISILDKECALSPLVKNWNIERQLIDGNWTIAKNRMT